MTIFLYPICILYSEIISSHIQIWIQVWFVKNPIHNYDKNCIYSCNGWNGERTGLLACLSPFAVKSVDKGHLLCLWFSKLSCYPNLFPNISLAHELNNFIFVNMFCVVSKNIGLCLYIIQATWSHHKTT